MLTIGKSGRRDFALPDDFITETIAILAKRGAGKTYLMRKLAEQMVKRALPVVIIDPIGVCWGLRSGADNGDLPLEAESGAVLADWVVAERRPVVFDLSAFPSRAAERRFVADFAERIYRKNRDPLHIMLDEADAFAPQSPQQGDKRMLGAINMLARRGRARGIGLTMATQRSAVLNKNVLTQAEVLVAMRMTAPQDRKAIEAWIEYHGTKEDRREVLGSLGELPVGEAWFWSPGRLDGLSRVKVGRCETFDSSATPKPGAKMIRPQLGPVDIGALSEKIQATVERARSEDPRELRAELARMRKWVSIHCDGDDESKCDRDMRHLREELERAKASARLLTEDERDAIRAGLIASENACDSLRDMVSAADDAQKLITDLTDLVKRLIDPDVPPTATYDAGPVELDLPSLRHVDDPNAGSSTLMVDSKKWDAASSNGARKLKGGERRILTALAQFGAMDKRRLAALTGYKMSGGGFQNLLNGLRTLENIGRGDPIEITAEGRRSLGNFTPLPTGPDLLALWLSKLPKASRMALEELAKAYRELTRERLAELTGYAAGGGGFSNALSKLNTLGLIDRTSTGLKATENLF